MKIQGKMNVKTEKKSKSKGPSTTIDKDGLYVEATSTYRIFSRLFCNFAMPIPPGRPNPKDFRSDKNVDNEKLDTDTHVETALDMVVPQIKDKTQLKTEKDKLKAEKDKLKADEKDKLKAEKDKLKAEKDKLKAEKDKLKADEKERNKQLKAEEKERNKQLKAEEKETK